MCSRWCSSPYGVFLTGEVGQDTISPLHLLHTLWPIERLSHAKSPSRVCGKVACKQLCAPAGVYPHDWVDIRSWQPVMQDIAFSPLPCCTHLGQARDSLTLSVQPENADCKQLWMNSAAGSLFCIVCMSACSPVLITSPHINRASAKFKRADASMHE